MMKLFLIFFSFISVTNAETMDFNKALELMKRGPKLDCDETQKGYPLSSSYRNNGANCSKFITASGEMGSHGKAIVTHLSAIKGSKFFDNNIGGMNAACPKWSKLSKAEKEYFWVWFFAALAYKESTCKEGQVNGNATHGTAVGYFQLNERIKDRKWRDGDSGSSCGYIEVRNSVPNIKCSLEIFNEQLKGAAGAYKGDGSIAGRGANSYWQDLRQKSNQTVVKMVKDFPPCK